MTSPRKGRSATLFIAGAAVVLWSQIHDTLRRQVRVAAGTGPEPSAGSIESQVVKGTRTSGPQGSDAGQKVQGIKQQLLVDTLGLLLVVIVHAANLQDRDEVKLVFARAKGLGAWLRRERVWADDGSTGQRIARVSSLCQWVLEIIKRNDDGKGFKRPSAICRRAQQPPRVSPSAICRRLQKQERIPLPCNLQTDLDPIRRSRLASSIVAHEGSEAPPITDWPG